MITNITLRNFKCFRELEVNPKLITVLIGPNGTGKSSVLQALLLLKQSVGQNKLQLQGEAINLGEPCELIPRFLSEESTMRLAFESEENDSRVQFSATFSSQLEPTPNSILPPTFSKTAIPLRSLRVVPAARGLVRPQYPLGYEPTDEISQTEGLSGFEEQLATNLIYRSPLEQLSSLLKRITGSGIRADMVAGRKIEVKSLTSSGANNIVLEGFGTNALIQLFLQLVTADKGATVLIEEPEIHLHPKAQAELAEVLADTAKADGKQIIMTTHSEHVAGRLLTLVAENKLTTDDLAIYSFEKDEKGECSASEIEVTELGQTKGGLTGFFETDLAEMDRYVKALQKKS